MASIHRDILIDTPASALWDAMRDPGALHTRLVPGFVAHCKMDGVAARQVRFANGLQTRELIVAIDDARRRIAWSSQSERLAHHNASTRVHDEGPSRCRVEWIADLLPDAMAPAVTAMIEAGLQAMKVHAEEVAAGG